MLGLFGRCDQTGQLVEGTAQIVENNAVYEG